MQMTNKIVFTFVLAFLTLCSLQAQRPDGGGRRGGDPKERANEQTDRMIEALDLSAAQGEKIRALNLAFADKMLAARTEAREAEDWESMRETMRTMRKEQNEKMKKYLTAEQVTKWEAILVERANRPRGEGRKRGRKGKKDKGAKS